MHSDHEILIGNNIKYNKCNICKSFLYIFWSIIIMSMSVGVGYVSYIQKDAFLVTIGGLCAALIFLFGFVLLQKSINNCIMKFRNQSSSIPGYGTI